MHKIKINKKSKLGLTRPLLLTSMPRLNDAQEGIQE